MSAVSPRLLVLACSQRKRPDPVPLPAIQRYDGPAFKVLRKYLRATPPQPALQILVLSAEYGLIAVDTPIPFYDRRMTGQRAVDLYPSAAPKLQYLIEQEHFRDVLLCMGEDYLTALGDLNVLTAAGAHITRTTGTIGRHLSDLYAWLRKDVVESHAPKPTARGCATIHGIELTLSTHEVLEAARESLAQAGTAASRYQSWYVQVDDARVAPKWLVSQLTSLPVSAFRTEDARRVLGILGVEVRHL